MQSLQSTLLFGSALLLLTSFIRRGAANCIPQTSPEARPPRCCDLFGGCGLFGGGENCAPPGSAEPYDDAEGDCPAIFEECQASECAQTPGCDCRFLCSIAGCFRQIPEDGDKGVTLCNGEVNATEICPKLTTYEECVSVDSGMSGLCEWDGTSPPTPAPTPRPSRAPTTARPTRAPTTAAPRPTRSPATPPPPSTRSRPTGSKSRPERGKCEGTVQASTCAGIFYDTCEKEPLQDDNCDPVEEDCKDVCDASLQCYCDRETIFTKTDFVLGVAVYGYTYSVQCQQLLPGGSCIVFDSWECERVHGCEWSGAMSTHTGALKWMTISTLLGFLVLL